VSQSAQQIRLNFSCVCSLHSSSWRRHHLVCSPVPTLPCRVESPPLKLGTAYSTKSQGPQKGQAQKARGQSKLHLQQQVVSCFSSPQAPLLPVPDPAHPAPDQRSGRAGGLHCPRILRCELGREGGARERAGS
jgi:hypothetical protein